MALVGEKRPSAEERELEFPCGRKKRAREVRRAAEIVLVLATMGEMRGGMGPTEEEREMMMEAREKLVRACEGFAPKDVFPGVSFESVMEDIGLTRSEDQKLGFRPSKMSIGEKFLITKHKRLKTNSSATSERHVALHATATPPSDKTNPVTFPSRVQPASPFKHGSTINSISQPYRIPPCEVRTPAHSSVLPTGLSGKDSTQVVPRVDNRPQLRPATRSNSSSYAPPVKVNLSGDQSLQKSLAFVQQVSSSLSAKSTPDNKVISQPSAKVEGPFSGTTSREATEASRFLPTQGSSLSNPHTEIGKIIQKFLRPQVTKHPIWNPPSRDYVKKPVPCQVCKVIINEVENALVCDSCEKGYHIKCVESNNQKGVPKGEWHCFKCLSLSNGKPLPPKYGRVTRNMSTPKIKLEKPGEKDNEPKIIANGSASSAKAFHLPIRKETQGNDMLSMRGDKIEKHPLENCQDDITKYSGSSCTSDSTGLSVKKALQKEKLDFKVKGQPHIKLSETGSKSSDHLKAPSNNLMVKDLEASYSKQIRDGNMNSVIRQEDQGVLQNERTDISNGGIIVGEQISFPPDISDNVDWIGDVLKVVDEQIYYQSCCVDGVVYKIQDHALLYSSKSNDQLTPSKIQAMWEDRKSRSKWVIANQCYFHDDFPKEVSRPFPPESNEVCESNHGITIMAGLIRGPCEVLPPGKHMEECQKRSRLSSKENDGLRPIFLCKWFFDEAKGSFRDVSS